MYVCTCLDCKQTHFNVYLIYILYICIYIAVCVDGGRGVHYVQLNPIDLYSFSTTSDC